MKKKKSYRIKKRDNYVKESRDEKVKSIAPFTSFIRDSSSEEARFKRIGIIYGILFGILMFIGTYFLKESLVFSFSFSLIFIIVYFAFFYFKRIFKLASKVEKMESSFPDFLQLVAGNLRAGITVDKAILLSARREFAPLDGEIARVGKDVTTGRSMEESLEAMARRIGSEKISKIVSLINSGLRSGGDLAILLERTASNMRERQFVEKRAASNVLMYEIFIFVAVAIGAPALFALSTILVETMINMLSNTPSLENTVSNLNVPFTFSSVDISLNFIIYYSLVFITFIGITSSLVIGLVSKGNEKAGIRYLPIIIILGFIVFFAVRLALSGFVSKI